MNVLRTGILMALMTGLFLVAGFLIGGQVGMAIAFLFAAGSNLFAYWNSDKMVLRMYGAREVDEASAPELVHLVRQLAGKAGLPMPRVFIAENEQPNAFATGRSPEHAAVCVTTALLARLDNEELAGVLAHELSHVKNRDTLTMTITATIAGAISMLANFAFFMGGGRNRNVLWLASLVMMLAPMAAVLVQIGDQPHARIRGRPDGRGNFRPAAVAGICVAAHRSRRAERLKIRKPMPIRRPRICSSSIRCMAVSRACSRAILRRRNALRG